MSQNVIKSTYAAQNSSARWQKKMDSPRDRNEIEARKIIDKHAQKVYNYVYTKWQAETPWPLGRCSWCGQLCWFAFYSIAIAFRRVALSTRQLLGGLKSCRTCGIRLVKASFYATVLHSTCKR